MVRKTNMTTMIRIREHEKVAPHLKRKMINRTGIQRCIHDQFLDHKLDEKGLKIKEAIDSALFTIDCEREGGVIKSADEECRIVMCFINEALNELGE